MFVGKREYNNDNDIHVVTALSFAILIVAVSALIFFSFFFNAVSLYPSYFS